MAAPSAARTASSSRIATNVLISLIALALEQEQQIAEAGQALGIRLPHDRRAQVLERAGVVPLELAGQRAAPERAGVELRRGRRCHGHRRRRGRTFLRRHLGSGRRGRSRRRRWLRSGGPPPRGGRGFPGRRRGGPRRGGGGRGGPGGGRPPPPPPPVGPRRPASPKRPPPAPVPLPRPP